MDPKSSVWFDTTVRIRLPHMPYKDALERFNRAVTAAVTKEFSEEDFKMVVTYIDDPTNMLSEKTQFVLPPTLGMPDPLH